MRRDKLVELVAEDIMKGFPKKIPSSIVVSGGGDFFRDSVIKQLRGKVKLKLNGKSSRVRIRELRSVEYNPCSACRPVRGYSVSLNYFIGKYDSNIC